MRGARVSRPFSATLVRDGQPGQPGETGNGVSGIASSFNLSKHGTSTNESTPPSDLYYGTWQTSQPEPSDVYPYVWKREVISYSKSASVTKYYCIGKKGDKGDSTPTYSLLFENYQAVFDMQTMKLSASFGLYVQKSEGTSIENITSFTPQFFNPDPSVNGWQSLSRSGLLFSDAISNVSLGTAPQSIRFRVRDGYTTIVSTAMPISIKGAQGDLGPLAYDAGDYNPDTIYTRTSSYTVSVDVPINGSDDECETYVLVANSNILNNVHIGPNDGHPEIWRQGVNKNIVKTKYLFTNFAKLGKGVVSGAWAFSTNGTIDGEPYNDGCLYGSDSNAKPGYMFFDPQSPLGSRDLGISAENFSNTGYSKKGNYFSLSGGCRIIKVTGKVTGGTMNIKVFDNNSALSGEYSITSTSANGASVYIVLLDVTTKETFNIRARMSLGSYYGTITSVKVISFAPISASDLLTGATYQGDSYVRGTIVSKTMYTQTVTIQMTGSPDGDDVYLFTTSQYIANTFLISIPNYFVNLWLPSATTYDGLELCFFHPTTGGNVGAALLKCSVSEIWAVSGNVYSAVADYEVPKNKLVRVRAIGGKWYVMRSD